MKLAIVGAGQVGGQAAFACAGLDRITNVTMIDAHAGLALGKALDIQASLAFSGCPAQLHGTDRLDAMQDADILVISAGFARRPGMQRRDLLERNAQIVAGIATAAARYAPACCIILVTNPVNVLAGLAQEITGFPPERLFGMGGVLDNARLRAGLALATRSPVARVETLVLGDHGEHMVPVLSECRVHGQPATQILGADELDAVIHRTRHSGTEIVNLLGNGSAYFAPGMAVVEVVRAIAYDEKRLLCCSTRAEGQYGLTGGYLGLPTLIGAHGVESIFTPALSTQEQTALEQAWENIQAQCRVLSDG